MNSPYKQNDKLTQWALCINHYSEIHTQNYIVLICGYFSSPWSLPPLNEGIFLNIELKFEGFCLYFLIFSAVLWIRIQSVDDQKIVNYVAEKKPIFYF